MKEELLIPSLAALAVALIAGVVSLVISILSKDQKNSEFRQAWIDGLRDDVSRLLGYYGVLDVTGEIIQKKEGADRETFLLAKHDEFFDVFTMVSRIRLRLNPDEHQSLILLLEANVGVGQFETRAKEISQATQVILKAEWERVKRGESSFVWLKRISRLLSTIALMGALFGAGMVIGEFMSGAEPSPSSECLDCET